MSFADDASTDAFVSDDGMRACTLQPGNPGTISLTGTACGQAVTYTSPPQLSLAFAPAQIVVNDSGNTTAVEIGQGDLSTAFPQAPGYFDTHDVFFHLAIDTTVDYSGSHAYPMSSGFLDACGFGALAFGPSMITLTFSGNSVQARADGVPVQAFDANGFGSLQATVCSGSISIQLQGAWTKL